MTTCLRLCFCLLFGTVAAVLLFGLMNALISGGLGGIADQRRTPVPQFIRMDEVQEAIPRREREKPRPPEKVTPIPRLEAEPVPQTSRPQLPSVDLTMPALRPDLALVGLPVAMAPAPVQPVADAAAPIGPAVYTQSLTPVYQVPPQYPIRARRQNISGWVRLEFIVRPDGSVSDIRVVEAEPKTGIFDQEATRALAKWRFQPQVESGAPVPAIATITIVFDLRG